MSRRLAWLGLAAALLAAPATAAAAALPAGAELRRDLAYGSDPLQRLDVYLPAHPEHAPVLVMVHGGAWFFGDKALDRVVASKIDHWVAGGAILVSVNYRLWPQVRPLEQAQDVARALAFVQAHAAAWGGDPGRLALMGHSAGGHLVALLAADRKLAQAAGVRPWRATVVLDGAALDLTATMKARHPAFYDRLFTTAPAYWREASPTRELDRRPGPLLVVCSSLRADGCPQPRALVARARALGGRAEFMTEPLSHNDINRTLGDPGGYTEAVDAFLRSTGVLP